MFNVVISNTESSGETIVLMKMRLPVKNMTPEMIYQEQPQEKPPDMQ